MKQFLLRLLVILFSTTCTLLNAQSVLQTKINKAANSKTFAPCNLSFSVYDLATQKEVAEHRSDKVVVPASSLKLFTTFGGLHYLGEDFRFKTIVAYNGIINDEGTLDGDIYIIGGGDPTLGSDRINSNMDFNEVLTDIANTILEKGIKCINGKIIVDESIYDSYPIAPSWQWNDLGNYYASGAWGLNVNENEYAVYFSNRKQIGALSKIKGIEPKVPGLNLSNEVLIDSVGSGDNAYIFGGPYNFDKRIVGTIPAGQGLFKIKGSIPDPPLFFGQHLQKKLKKINIQSKDIETIFRPRKLKYKTLDTLFSPTLTDIVRRANLESNNLYTESILKMIGLKKRGQGSGQNGIAAVKKLIRKYKLKTNDLQFHDGSGLSARNLISSKSLAGFLAGISKDIDIDQLKKRLPRGGIEGTVKGLLKGSPAKGKVWVKSGSMSAVQSYTGYVETKSGKTLSFCLIVNGFSDKGRDVRSKLDQIIRDIYNYG